MNVESLMNENDLILIRKLDEFIRKFYKNQVLRGALLSIALLSLSYLFFDLLEYFFRFPPLVRSLLFFIFLGSAAAATFAWIVRPFLKLMRIGKILSYEKAAIIVGSHFPEIEDKLLNTLQLMSYRNEQDEDTSLLVASVDQKIKAIKPFRFTMVIDLKTNLKYLRYALPPLIIILAGVVIAPNVISHPARRILHFSTPFQEEFPFGFVILNSELKTIQQSDFLLRVKFSGEEIPVEIFVKTDGTTYKMQREKDFVFSHHFHALQVDLQFRILAGDMVSDLYTIKVYPKPIILNFGLQLEYPAYIRKPSDKFENTGDMSVPEGTRATWSFNTRDVDSLTLKFGERRIPLDHRGNNAFSASMTVTESGKYDIFPSNAYTKGIDSMSFRITAIKDAFPTIMVEEGFDTAMATSLFFRGTIKDDYGFSRLMFHYEVIHPGDSSQNIKKEVQVPINAALNSQVFYHMADLSGMISEQGDEVTWYFEVWDNDGIHGPKATRSELRYVKTPTLSDIENKAEENEKLILNDLKGSLDESKQAKKAIDELNKKMIDENAMNFQDRKKLEEIIKSSDNIIESIEKIKQQNEDNIRNEEKFLNTDPNILEKQRRLNELMDQVLTEEMKKNLKDLKALLDQVDKTKLGEALEKMKLTNKDLEEQLDRNLQLFKQIEFDRKLSETVKGLRETSETLKKLADAIDKMEKKGDQALNEQKQINNRYDSLKKDMEDLKSKEKELEEPVGLNKTDKLQDSISKNLKEGTDKLENKQEKSAGSRQKEAANQMDRLAEQLETMGEDSEQEQMGEDMDAIRMILENLVRMSFQQEDLMGKTGKVNRNDPKYQQVIVSQKEIGDKLQSVEDSLKKIAKRQMVIAPVINREITAINRNLDETVTALNNRSVTVAMTKQQYTMTSINNLAILLDESLKQMNENMQNAVSGKGQSLCKKPSTKGGSKPIKGLRDLQQKLSDQMNDLKKGLEEQKNKEGMPSQSGQGSMSEKIARMAAEQEAIRNELQDYQRSLEEQGIKDGGNVNSAIQEMDQNERDLINKRISQETLLRQQRIITRLLESEKAELTREKEEKRESHEQKTQFYRNFTGDFEYNKLLKGENELMRYKSLPLNEFYKSRTNSYMIKIGQ
jgi:hypothetical protein